MNLIECTQQFLGTPWKLNGRTREGFDCYGYVRELLRVYNGTILPDFTDATKNNVERAAAIYRHLTDVVRPSDTPRRIGDIVLLAYMGETAHIAVYVGGPYISHCSQHVGVHLSTLTEMDHGRTIEQRIQGWYTYVDSHSALQPALL